MADQFSLSVGLLARRHSGQGQDDATPCVIANVTAGASGWGCGAGREEASGQDVPSWRRGRIRMLVRQPVSASTCHHRPFRGTQRLANRRRPPDEAGLGNWIYSPRTMGWISSREQ